MTEFRATLRRRTRGDDGTTLVELLVGMGIMAIFMAMFTSAIFLMTSATNKVDATATSAAATNTAFLELDKSIRYASAISTPGKSTGGDWYVEVSEPGGSSTTTCVQYRIHAQQLQQRSWAVDASSVAGTASGWSPIASSVVNGNAAAGAANVPFSLLTPTNSLFQQLAITVQTGVVSPATGTSSATATFTALNSTRSFAGTVCQQMGRP